MVKRILLVYEGLSTDKLSPLKRSLEAKFENSTILHCTEDILSEFTEERDAFDFVFIENSLEEEKIKTLLSKKGKRFIKGVLIDDGPVANFITTL